jgi:DNA-binding NtrC family response regulator
MLVRVLLVIQRSTLRERLQKLLSQRSVILSFLPADVDLVEHLQGRSTDLVLVDELSLSAHEADRGNTVAAIHELSERPDVVVLIQGEKPELRTALTSAGAIAVVNEKLLDSALEENLRALLRRRREDVQRSLGFDRREDQARLSDFVSNSPTMSEFLDVVRRVVATTSSLLILGETGVGKERLARAIHAEGPRARAPFLAVNCAALPEPLLESELFGYEEGAFTGAIRQHRGHFEVAHRGTIFLDEIGEMPPHLQVKLLRVLQEKRIHPVGSESPVGVDVRVMAATNRDLATDLRHGRFRADLYYRIGVVTLAVPPLRERREDIQALTESFVAHFRPLAAHRLTGVHPAAMAAILSYSWPGNVRELINVVERAVLLCNGSEITLADLPGEIRDGIAPSPSHAGRAAGPGDVPAPELLPWRTARQRAILDFERKYFTTLLRATGGRIGVTARLAQIDPRALYDKLKRLSLRKEDFRPAMRESTSAGPS